MKQTKLLRAALAALLLWTGLCIAAPAALAVSDAAEQLPGRGYWQPYLEQSPIDLEKAASAP